MKDFYRFIDNVRTRAATGGDIFLRISSETFTLDIQDIIIVLEAYGFDVRIRDAATSNYISIGEAFKLDLSRTGDICIHIILKHTNATLEVKNG